MRFRPCIDIHNGKVKQIVGSTLQDRGDEARENYVAAQDAAYFARMYERDGLTGGHVILLNPSSSPFYEATREQAFAALSAAPGTLMAGGGINPENAAAFLEHGASHVIVTSWVFREGRMDRDRLEAMVRSVGKDRLVLDRSCRRQGDGYYIVTDRWQKFTSERLTAELLDELSESCAEFLVHAVDVEGKQRGPETEVIRLLGAWKGCPVTYAGGIGSFEDLETLRREGQGRLDVTIGSALDLFGGSMPYREVLKRCREAI